MAELSPETLAKFRAFRRARTANALGRAGQIVGGTAETMRTGRSAAETFAARDPDLLRQRGRAEMLQQADAQMKVAKEQSAQERYYFEQEQQERISLLSDYAQRVQMEYDRARADADRAQRGSQAKAHLLVRVAELEKLQRDIDNRMATDTLTPGAETVTDSVLRRFGMEPRKGTKSLPKTEEQRIRKEALAQQMNEILDGLDPEGKEFQRRWNQATRSVNGVPDPDAPFVPDGMGLAVNPKYLTMEELLASEPAGDAETETFGDRLREMDKSSRPLVSQARAERAMDFEAGAESQPQFASESEKDSAFQAAMQQITNSGMNKHDEVLAIEKVMLAFGKTVDQARELLGTVTDEEGNTTYRWDAMVEDRRLDQKDLDDAIEKQEQTLVTAAGKTFGGDARIQGIIDVGEAYRRATALAEENAYDPNRIETGKDEDDDGIPDIEWAPTAAERFRQTLDMIDAYPDKPVAQYAKQSLMSSPEFAQFKEHYGYKDDAFAFREMNKLAKQQDRENKRSDRLRKKMNVRHQLGQYRDRQGTQRMPKEKKVTEAADLVTGATGSRIAE
jgi:hypothetical protein